jgi:galactonate dehydratase
MDILGKSSKAPLYETLGGPTRNKARAMAVVEGESTAAIRAAVLRAKQSGHRAFSIPLSVPSGMERGREFYKDVRERMDALREAAGEECDFVLDCGGRTIPGEAISIADRLQDFHLLWLDEPCGELSVPARASISQHTVTAVGFGRTFTENSTFQDLLRESGIDVLRPAITLNGVTTIRKAAAIAETYYIAVAPYNRGGPIATAAGVHIAASLPNSFIQETPFSMNEADRRMRREIAGGWDEAPDEGFFKLLEGPGLGLAVNDDALANYTVSA